VVWQSWGWSKDVDLMIRLTKRLLRNQVKNRLGWDDNSINIDEVAERLQDVGLRL
jgi:tRNA-dihydrouridine synthase